tara:strand:+ start:926 stop:1153 length:228 start_codon:yes stop_codon:yes gene_type:complete
MKVGDLVWIVATSDDSKHGIGLYLGRAQRGEHVMVGGQHYAFLWKGRVATFDKPYWHFKVCNSWKRLNEGYLTEV